MPGYSKQQLEDISRRVLTDYYKSEYIPAIALDIFRFAQEYLHLRVWYADLRCRGLLGLTAYAETALDLPDGRMLALRPGDVILSTDLLEDMHPGRLHFTLAHECAHQILHTGSVRGKNEETSPKKTESEADRFAAFLLMPKEVVDEKWKRMGLRGKLRLYPGDNLLFRERMLLRSVADQLGVSVRALLIRTRELGWTEERSMTEYYRLSEEEYCLGG